MRTNMPSTAKPHAVMAEWKTRSETSPLEACSRGDSRADTDVTFVGATGCGPGISGRGNPKLAIAVKLAESCYKGVKNHANLFPFVAQPGGIMSFGDLISARSYSFPVTSVFSAPAPPHG